MVGNTVRVTRPSRSSPRSVRVSIRCEMPPTMRLISLKRRGPLPSSMITNTLHLSPTRARIEATPRQSLSRCGWGGRTGTFLCSGFNGVLGFQKCAFLRGLWTVTHIVSVTNLYQGDDNETSAHRFKRAGPPLREPPGFRGDRGT